MTENDIKEALSESFVRLILAHDKFHIAKHEKDYFADLTVYPMQKSNLPNPEKEVIYLKSGNYLDIQLKCTTYNSIKIKNGFVEYQLRYKNFYDLKQKVESDYEKMILILFILPEDESTWINVVEDQMLLKKHCFWYIPEDSIFSSKQSLKNKNSKEKILIPFKQHLLKDFRTIYNSVYGI